MKDGIGIRCRAFTLIELLIVVAIIAILAAIAVPNFLEAQTRSKVSRTRADMRTAGMALETYAIDYNGHYPPLTGNTPLGMGQTDRGGFSCMLPLSTPVAYLSTTMVMDPFSKHQIFSDLGKLPKQGSTDVFATLHVINIRLFLWNNYKQNLVAGQPPWFLMSLGPDFTVALHPTTGTPVAIASYGSTTFDPTFRFDMFAYDPSNGTISGGDILRRP